MLGDEGGGAEREEEEESGVRGAAEAMMRRKEKRKAMKKEKRRLSRRVSAVKVREEESARVNDIEETIRIEEAERDEAAARERAIIEFEEREKAWAERKKKEEEVKKALEEEEELETKEKLNHAQRDEVKADDENDGWEYVEEGPAEIIWKGNEIIVKKKKMRVQKKDGDQPKAKEDTYLPTSNPLPPQSEAFADYNSSLVVSAQQLLENVASQVPNFGTEQDKAHCPFHLKTGACRFGQRCSRVHFYPDKSCTLLIRNMYNGPGLTLEQDEGLEYTDEETEHCYEEFYEDVHTEFLKFGELENFKVCKNGSFHLRGNVYVHYKSVDSAILAYHSLKGRYFAGKQVKCEFVNVSRWKVAICGEYMKSRYKTCSHGTACNFIHCFHNPGGEYEWADWEKPPPRYWIKKMVALFGHCEGYDEEKWIAPGKSSHQLKKSPRPRRFRSREKDCSFKGKSRGSYVEEDSIKSWRNHQKGRNPSERGDYVNQHGHHSHDTAAGGNDEDARPVDQEKDGRASHSHTRRNVKRTHHRDSESDGDNMYKLDESLEKEDWPGHSSCRSLKYRKKGRREECSKGSAHGSEVTYVDDPDKHRSMRHGKKSRDPGYHDSDIEDRWDPGRYSLEALVEKQ